MTYEEIHNPQEVGQCGIDLVPRLANILRRRGAVFADRTNDSQWATCEEELGFSLPPDYKLLCNTIGNRGRFGNGHVGLQTPAEIIEQMKEHTEDYDSWQDENVNESGAEWVGIYPGQPGHHLQWSVDYEGDALAYFWIVNHPTDPSRWPTVMLDLEAPLRHNSSILPATVTEILLRDVTNKLGANSLTENDDDEEDNGEDIAITIDGRCIYKFETGGEPDKKRTKAAEEEGVEEDPPGSAKDKADFAVLDGDLEPVALDACTATAPVAVD